MLIEDFLKQENARLSCEPNWLYWDDAGYWVVLSRPFGARKNQTLYQGESLERALQALKGS